MRRLVSIVAVVAALGAAVVLSGATEGPGVLKTYEIEFDSAFGLVAGGDLKIGGVKAGSTSDFTLSEREPYRAIVTAEVTQPGFDSLRTDAECQVRAQSLIGEYFVDCDLGKDAKRLPDGGRVPVKQTSSTIPPDLINDVMRRPYRERFRLIVSELGTGLAGRPEELNDVIRRAHPALRELTETIGILRDQNKVISKFFKDADTVSAAVEPFKRDVARWAREAEDTSAIQASRSEELGRYWERLPDFLAELKPTMSELERTATAQIPTLRKLGGAAPELERFLRASEPFARETRGAIGPLGETAEAGSEAVRQAKEEIRELNRLAPYAPRLGKRLRQFLQAIDDRRRSTENEPSAGPLAPPAPDKTAFKKGQGHTGMEAFWNYIYFQTLAVNSYDEIGHLLRIVLFAGGPCAPYSASPTAQEIKECNSWLGPNQPGITSPDPTDTNGAGAAKAASTSERSKAGAATGPDKGERDLSKPQVTIPEDLRRLLDRVPQNAPVTPAAPGGSGSDDAAVPVLDYLLAP